MTTVIKPCGHHLVVEPMKLPEKSAGGIIINFEGTQFEKLERAGRMVGVIEAIGPQCWKAHAAALADCPTADVSTRADWAVVGETVLYSRHAGKFMFDPISGAEMYLIHDEDVLAILPPQEEWAENLLDLVG